MKKYRNKETIEAIQVSSIDGNTVVPVGAKKGDTVELDGAFVTRYVIVKGDYIRFESGVAVGVITKSGFESKYSATK